MRICRYQQGGRSRWGVVDGETVRELHGDPTGDFRVGHGVGQVPDVALLAPCEPTKVICDVVLTGTSAGIRPVRSGDVMRVDIEGIGTLTNPVVGWCAERDGR